MRCHCGNRQELGLTMRQDNKENSLQACWSPLCQDGIDGVGVGSASHNLHNKLEVSRPEYVLYSSTTHLVDTHLPRIQAQQYICPYLNMHILQCNHSVAELHKP